MSTTPQVVDPQAIPLRKVKHSRKAPAIKTAVILKRASGQAKSHIARDLGITHNTVNAILEESDIERHLSTGQQLCVGLIPKGAQAIEKAFDRGDGALAVRMFEGLGILGSENFKRGSLMKADVHLNLAIQNLIQAKPLESTLNCALADTPKPSEEK